jgi:hypothetical protein
MSDSRSASARLAICGGEQTARPRLAALHGAPEFFECRPRRPDDRDHDRLRRIAGGEIELAQSIERSNRPICVWRCSSETEFHRLRPRPQHARHQPVIEFFEQSGELVGLGSAINRDGEARDLDWLRQLLALDPVRPAAKGL